MRAMSASSGIVCAARGKQANAGFPERVWRCLGAATTQGSAGVRVVPRFIDRHPLLTVRAFAVRILDLMLRARGDEGHKNAFSLCGRSKERPAAILRSLPPAAHLVE